MTESSRSSCNDRHDQVGIRVIPLVIALGLVNASCWPVITNLSKGDTVPKAIAELAPNGTEILVLPLWTDADIPRFHRPYVVPASAIGTSAADVPRRMGVYIDYFACGGPSNYVEGYLVVLESGTAVWSSQSGQKIAGDRRGLKRELTALFSEGKVGPALTELIPLGALKIGVDTTKDERAAAMRFLEKVPEEE